MQTKFTCRPELFQEAEHKVGVMVVDADNCELRYCVYVDMETGICVRSMMNPDGSLTIKDGQVGLLIENRPLPLRMVEIVGDGRET